MMCLGTAVDDERGVVAEIFQLCVLLVFEDAIGRIDKDQVSVKIFCAGLVAIVYFLK